MLQQYLDTMSSDRHGWRLLLRLVAVTAVAFALVAASVSAAPASLKSSPASPTATAAAGCTAQMMKGGQLVDLYERYYKYAFKKVKGSKKYKRVIVRARRKLQTSCARPCIKTKTKKGKAYPVYAYTKKRVVVRKGNRLVKVKKKVRVYVYQRCPTGSGSSGTTVKITLLPGSIANLDFGAFQRQAPVMGTVGGFIAGGYKLNQDNQIALTRGSMQLGQTDVFVDDDCNGQVSASIRTGDPTNVLLDLTRQSISNVMANQTVTATVYVKVQLPLELRNDDTGCNQPYISTGYTEFTHTFYLKGKIEKATGLTKLHLTSAPDPLDVTACLSPGAPTSPCNNSSLELVLPIIVNLDLQVSVQLNA